MVEQGTENPCVPGSIPGEATKEKRHFNRFGVFFDLIQLSDGSGLKMTTEEYYTPNRNKINKVGITPDYEVDLPSNIEKLTDENDTQLQKAIELLK